MDDVRQPCEAAGPCVPRLASQPPTDPTFDFAPLRLVLQPGGLCIELTKPDMLVGRHSTADVRLSLPDISRRHCRFVFTEGCWRVLDLNSLNGVFVNGERLQDATIFQGDRLRIGSLTFEADLGHDEVPSPGHPRVTHLMPGQPDEQSIRKAS
jgi:predicted component of type VI protein secretion system